MNNSYLDELLANNKNILLLQSPVGSFFVDFNNFLIQQGKKVFKINFNGGDDYFYSPKIANTFQYKNSVDNFSEFLTDYIIQNKIDAVVCFGDTRIYHQLAKKVCCFNKKSFWAFEEGYFRPNFITLEKSGVNNYSILPLDADFYLKQQQDYPEVKPVKYKFLAMTKASIKYYLFMWLKRKQYPLYSHHRSDNINFYLKLWSKSSLKRIWLFFKDRKFSRDVKNGKYNDFFIVPLQVYNDSQVRIHCDFGSVESFIKHVLNSFVFYAPKDLKLIFKHHPMDRGFLDYNYIFKQYIKKYPQLKNRIFYVHDIDMPVLLRQAKAMICINSTSGLSALIHNLPVKLLGRSNYDIKGITSSQSLAKFWQNPQKPNQVLFEKFRIYHLNKTQINGSFYYHAFYPNVKKYYE